MGHRDRRAMSCRTLVCVTDTTRERDAWRAQILEELDEQAVRQIKEAEVMSMTSFKMRAGESPGPAMTVPNVRSPSLVRNDSFELKSKARLAARSSSLIMRSNKS
jgi:hypothetical protein